MTHLTVLIPVNRLDRAKGRLAELLDGTQRAALALATLETVVEAVSDAGMDAVVLTGDEAVAKALPGVRVLDEDPGVSGLNTQLEYALGEIDRPEMLILHADLPLATGSALRALARAAMPAPSVTMVESPDGGTNAMLLRPPARFALAYGRDSAALHRAAAISAGMPVTTIRSPELELDLDTPGDLAALLEGPGGAQTKAGQLLARWGIRTVREG